MIRQATKEDVVDLALLMEELGYPTTINEMEARFAKINANPSYHTLVAEKDDLIVGMMGMYLGYGYESNDNYVRIVAVVVHSNYRKHGIGSALLREAETYAKAHAAHKLVLNSGNRDERDLAHQFYISKGFEGTATGFYKKL